MKFIPADLAGVWIVECEPHVDERGSFSRTWCEEEFAQNGLNTRWPQGNMTRTVRRGAIRGMHWQAEPRPEIKLVRCTRGAIWDVVVDVRMESPTFGSWLSVELSRENARQLYVPAGFAHGFQCLEDDCEVSYLMGETYFPDLARGIRWDDPEVAIAWPLQCTMISRRDQELPALAALTR